MYIINFFRFQNLDLLVKHQADCHNIICNMSSHTFSSISKFLDWKKSTELDSNSLYVQQCSMQASQSSRRWYYYCNRGGKYKPKGEGKRSVKVQGTNKIGICCTAHMKVVQDIVSDEVSVKFCSSHNHAITLGHIPISEDSRMLIVRQLQEGVAIEKIFDNIRDNVEGSIKRLHIINRQDVNNIKRQFNIEGIEKHKDDQQSVCAWVTELKTHEYDPVTVFKPQGKESADFLLGIQTKFQCEMMKVFGEKLICMDATHGTNHYDFKLVTVLVLDDFGEGIPVGWLVSNKEDGTVLKEFLKSLLARTGPIETKYFMSDDAEQYFSSWKEVFRGQPRKLLCAWHVDKAWKSKLQTVTNIETKGYVYCCLRTILQSLDVREFRKLSCNKLSRGCFPTHARKTFVNIFKRIMRSDVNNGHTAFVLALLSIPICLLRHFIDYLQGKCNRRVDQLLSVLLRIARDKVFDRITKTEKGKSTYRLGEINQRHRSAVKMLNEGSIDTIQVESSLWKVSSESSPSAHYFVKQIDGECNCRLRCASCRGVARISSMGVLPRGAR